MANPSAASRTNPPIAAETSGCDLPGYLRDPPPWTDSKGLSVEPSVPWVFTLRHVANLLTTDELEKVTLSMVAKLRPLSLVQRETVIRAVLEDDERARRRRRGSSPSTTFALAVRRDSVM